jgi:hypothetical protein
MAAIARPGVCEKRNRLMSKKLSVTAASVGSGKATALSSGPCRACACKGLRGGRIRCDDPVELP